MVIAEFLTLLFLASILAGFLGSIAGLGGGVVIVPVLTLGFGVDIHFAIGASIIAIIGTSSGAASTYVKGKVTNLRVGMFLELATTTGAVIGAAVAAYAGSLLLELIFGIILLISLVPTALKFGQEIPSKTELQGLAKRLKLSGSYSETDGSIVSYNPTRAGVGIVGMLVAGLLSGLLGIGSGAFKVLSMDLAMKLPTKVSTTTSNFMIGVTAAASAGIYFLRGDVNPAIVSPVAVGILIGALAGARTLVRTRSRTVRLVFVGLLALVGVEMVLNAIGV